MIDEPLASAVDLLVGVVDSVGNGEDVLLVLGTLAVAFAYPALATIQNGIEWYGNLDAWKQFGVASLVGFPILIFAGRGFSALRGVTIPLAGLGIIVAGVFAVRRGPLTPMVWLSDLSGLKLFAAASVVPAVFALTVPPFTNYDFSPINLYTAGLPLAGSFVVLIRLYQDS
jgi:hypothetical protein